MQLTADQDDIFAYIQDADLWQWQLPSSKQFQAGLAGFGLEYDCNKNPQIFQQLLQLTVASIIQRVSCWSRCRYILHSAPFEGAGCSINDTAMQLQHQSLHGKFALEMLSLSCQQLDLRAVLLEGIHCDLAGAAGTGRTAEACGCCAGGVLSYCPRWP